MNRAAGDDPVVGKHQRDGFLIFEFDEPFDLQVREESERDWQDYQAREWNLSDDCAGRLVDVASGKRPGCLVEYGNTSSDLYWETTTGTHVWFRARRATEPWVTAEELLAMANSMKPLP